MSIMASPHQCPNCGCSINIGQLQLAHLQRIGYMGDPARGIGVRSTTTEGRGPEGAEPGPKDAPKSTDTAASHGSDERASDAVAGLPPLPPLSTDRSPWKEILAWSDACRGPEAKRAANALDAALAEMLREYARAALTASSEASRPQRTPLTDEQIEKIILEELRKYGDVGARRALTYDSGPYEITNVTNLGFSIARAIERASLSGEGV